MNLRLKINKELLHTYLDEEQKKYYLNHQYLGETIHPLVRKEMNRSLKAKKNFNRFSNQWLARAMQNGGSIGMSFTNKSELVIEKKMKEFRKRQEIAEQDSAPKDWVKDLISQTKRKMQNK